MRRYGCRTVDEYIASSPKEAQPVLEELRRIVKSAVPDAEERISWGIPFYRYHGPLCGFAVFKGHVSFGMGGPSLPADLRQKLERRGYRTGKKVIQIRFDQEVPEAEIRRLLELQAKKNHAKRRRRGRRIHA